MNEIRKNLYDEWREKYADDPAKSVGWRNEEALEKRFDVTMNHLAHSDFSNGCYDILDVGCGCSLNLLRWIPANLHRYIGIDCNHESLKKASYDWNIPYNENYEYIEGPQLLLDESLDKVKDLKFDIILVQGVYQEFDSIRCVASHMNRLASMLRPGGELLIMTPTNRLLDAGGPSVLRLSAHDAVSIMEFIGKPYELSLGELGEHLILRVYN